MQQTTVLLVFGGESSEHEVSISSARNVFAALDDTKYDINLCYIDTTGKWWLLESFSETVSTQGALKLVPVLGSKSFMTVPEGKFIMPDVILPILHGANGEDGTIQGLARLLHIPIVGTGLLGSAVAMDKVVAKQLLQAGGINVVPYDVHDINDPEPNYNQLTMMLGSPLFVKPANGGSSVGVFKVDDEQSFQHALREAHNLDDKVLIERGIAARELEVAVLGHTTNPKSSTVGEIIPDEDFYSYESKYSSASTTEVVIPADITESIIHDVRETAIKAFKILSGEGLSRVDFFLSEDNELYLNEVNTLPGFTNISMYPKLWKYEGVSYMELIDQLIELALDTAEL